ncbi:hypothetical protein [Paludibacterium denitrificans]|uniref:Uncharacterized protein n=1 Tax=Paludibacterium denitrificans TaxID=2675226 RepID=A0A844GCP3_9NEIS|nr:hypothetical protein [Paludibacterium denitrificans]MTD33061.1 hypothetical protein [Paludibacterium denitrificans]
MDKDSSAMIGTARIKPDALGGIYRSARLSDINWTSGRVALSIWWAKLVPIFISMPPVDRYRDLEANQPAKNTLITGILNSWWAAANTKRQHPRFDLLCQRWQVSHTIKHEINADEILEVLASYLATLRASELHFILDLTKECMNFGVEACEEAVS